MIDNEKDDKLKNSFDLLKQMELEDFKFDYITNVNQEMLCKNVSDEDKIKFSNEFAELLKLLQNNDENGINEVLQRLNILTHYNISMNHTEVEYLLSFSMSLERNTNIYDKVNELITFIFLTRPNLSIEIVDSGPVEHLMQLISQPVKSSEIKLMIGLFNSFETLNTLNDKYNFLDNLIKSLNDPMIPLEQILLRHELVISILTEYYGDSPRSYELTDYFALEIFKNYVKKYIFEQDEQLFGMAVHVYKILLERDKPEFFHFFAGSDVDQYLLSRLLNCRQIVKENILSIFLNGTSSSNIYTKAIYDKQLVQNFQNLVPQLNESCHVIMIQTLQNCFSLGIEVVLEIASRGFFDLALKILKDGQFKSQIIAIKFFAEICGFSNDLNVQNFLIQYNIIPELVEYLNIPKLEGWRYVLSGLHLIVTKLLKICDDNTLFQHPLFSSLNLNEFYDILCSINDSELLEKKTDYKDVQVHALFFLEKLEEIIDI